MTKLLLVRHAHAKDVNSPILELIGQPEADQVAKVAGGLDPELSEFGNFQNAMIAETVWNYATNLSLNSITVLSAPLIRTKALYPALFALQAESNTGPSIAHQVVDGCNGRGLGSIEGVEMGEANAMVKAQPYHYQFDPESGLYLAVAGANYNDRTVDGKTTDRTLLQTSKTDRGVRVAPDEFDFSKDALNFEPAHQFYARVQSGIREYLIPALQKPNTLVVVSYSTHPANVISKSMGFEPKKSGQGGIDIYNVPPEWTGQQGLQGLSDGGNDKICTIPRLVEAYLEQLNRR